MHICARVFDDARRRMWLKARYRVRLVGPPTEACLKWMDDFKKSSGKGEATLHFQIHGPEQAIRLIEQDTYKYVRGRTYL